MGVGHLWGDSLSHPRGPVSLCGTAMTIACLPNGTHSHVSQPLTSFIKPLRHVLVRIGVEQGGRSAKQQITAMCAWRPHG